VRSLIATLLLLGMISTAAWAQQSNEPKKEKKPKEPDASKTEQTQPATKPPDRPAAAPDETKPEAGKADKEDKEEHHDMKEVPPVVTHHQITLNGKALNYTATAGRLPIKRSDGKIEAEMFFVAYTLDGQDAAKRPLTFAFNGGPGSATIWLHMGALGPKRVEMKPDGTMPPAPYRITDNQSTLLDKSDIVLIDAIGTGYSRAGSPDLFKKFWGVKGDIQSFSEFIRLYLSRYERWGSPLFLFGESYGTTRAAGISGYLADRGISFNGITLLSMALSFQTLEFNSTNDEPYILLVPSFTTIAGYHHKLPPDLAQDMAKARQESEHWAATDYAQALAKGDAITQEDRQKTIEQMARYTGLSKEVLDQANLRIDVNKFTHYLLIDQKLRVGRLDGRFTGPDPKGLLDTPEYDPTEPSILPPYISTFHTYLRNELGYKSDMPYYAFAEDAGFEKWDWGSAVSGFPDTAANLREAMVKNPYVKVLAMEGYYDLATPYFAANYTIDHLNLAPKYRGNISYATFESGHMVYLSGESLKKMKADEAGFMDRALGQ
jgi:carboxypeptidase C (cathepsin A)